MSGPAWPDDWWAEPASGAPAARNEAREDRQDPDTVETRWERAREHEQHRPESVRTD